MENGNNQNYGRDDRDFNQDLDTLIDKENANKNDKYQNQKEFIDDVNHQSNDYNRNESSPNGEDQITNDEEPDDLDDDFNENDLDDEDDDSKKDNLKYIEEDLDEVSHDPFPSLDWENF